ncbi:hypothetical protein [Geodermatophilus sp. DSM 45219]|uniref:hypothetical protein n=1 Tax=Geodermatophilus sp. DSM 45219 TaxID=1881103 RepID=UPI000890B80D|nr:hypothetical protein [Geodermatophilus sp. DSM 45219]SDO53512.1 hypothetical protein SAMN05428965_4277 [Geodermatophilus sp. DSM 45219]
MRDDELRDRLHALAAATAPPPRGDLAAVVERRHRARRRAQLRGGAAAVAVAAAAVVAVPVVADGEPAGSVAAVAEGAPADAAVPGGPTRGSLAGDAAFLEAVRQLSWSDPGAGAADPPPAGSQVVFAGDVPSGRWALVSRPLTVPPPLVDDDELERRLGVDSVALAWFAGPPGAEPDELRLRTGPVVTAAGEPAALWDPATGTLAVVSPPPASTARVVDGDGAPLAELALVDGVAVQSAPEGTATVEVLAADGAVLASVEPLTARGG